MSNFSLSQVIDRPTYSSGSLLDVILVSDRNIISRSGTRTCHFSPHQFVRAAIVLPRPNRKPAVVECRSTRHIDRFSFCSDLLVADWSLVYRSYSTAEQWQHFMDVFMPILEKHAPVRRVKIRNPTAPPVSDETKQLMSTRRRALHDGDTDLYRSANRGVRASIRRDSRESIRAKIREQGPNSMWRNIRPIVAGKRPQAVIPPVGPDDMNSYFVQVGPRVAREVRESDGDRAVPCRLPRVGSCAFTVQPTDGDTLRAVVFSMRGTSACGLDGLSIKVVKLCYDVIGPLLQHIINSCLSRNDFPRSWKHSLVRPIFKSGDPTMPSNYRPISLLPVIAKITERIVQRQLYHYLSSNCLLSDSQHGFRPNHSTTSALIGISDNILAAMDDTEISLLCLIDLSKCFDVIDHSKLLVKLQLLGIDAGWFRSYLGGHTQSVCITNSMGRRVTSKSLPNDVGVFQGSALGPLLFTVFANDLSLHAPDAYIAQYADDTQVLVSGPKSALASTVARLEVTLAAMSDWFAANGLKVNAEKTELMALGSRQNLRVLPDINVRFRDAILRPCKQVRNLGVVFDSSLTWDDHVATLARKCFGALIGLSHVRHHLPGDTIVTIVNALVLSHIRYCLPVYGNCSKRNLGCLSRRL